MGQPFCTPTNIYVPNTVRGSTGTVDGAVLVADVPPDNTTLKAAPVVIDVATGNVTGVADLGVSGIFSMPVGGTAPSLGDMRVGSNFSLVGDSSPTGTNHGMVFFSVSESLELGSTVGGTVSIPNATRMDSASATAMLVGGDNKVRCDGTTVEISDPLEISSTGIPASAGDLRVGSGFVMNADSAPTGTNHGLLGWSAGEQLSVGHTIGGATRPVGVVLDASLQTIIQVGGTSRVVANTTGLGFFDTTPVAQPADTVALTDETGGAASDDVVAVPPINGSGATTAQEDAINDNFADLIAKYNALRTLLRDLGLMA